MIYIIFIFNFNKSIKIILNFLKNFIEDKKKKEFKVNFKKKTL